MSCSSQSTDPYFYTRLDESMTSPHQGFAASSYTSMALNSPSSFLSPYDPPHDPSPRPPPMPFEWSAMPFPPIDLDMGPTASINPRILVYDGTDREPSTMDLSILNDNSIHRIGLSNDALSRPAMDSQRRSTSSSGIQDKENTSHDHHHESTPPYVVPSSPLSLEQYSC